MRRSARTWIALLTLAVLPACGDSSMPEAAEPSEEPASDVTGETTRIVEHARGQTEVPGRPRRVVALQSPTNMMALGVDPLGGWRLARDKAHHPALSDRFEDMVDLGTEPFDLEPILSLEPDLIVGRSPGHDDIYDRLSQMAPTVLSHDSGTDSGGDWKEQFLFTAEVLGKEREAQRLLAAYRARIHEFQTRMGERLTEVEVSVVRPSGDAIRLWTKSGFAGSVLEDAGVRRPPSQDLDATQTEALAGDRTNSIDISPERLREADADLIILWTSSSPLAANQGTNDARTADLKASPIWNSLGAVQRGDVHEVGGHWVGQGILEANLILDDLSAALLGDGR